MGVQEGVETRETWEEAEGYSVSFRGGGVLGGIGMEEIRIYIITFALAALVYNGICTYFIHSHLDEFPGITIYAFTTVLLGIIGVYGSFTNSIIALRAYAHFLLFDSCVTALPRFVLLYFFSTMRELLCHLPQYSPHVHVSEMTATEVGNCTLLFRTAFAVMTVFVVGVLVLQVCMTLAVTRFVDTLRRVGWGERKDEIKVEVEKGCEKVEEMYLYILVHTTEGSIYLFLYFWGLMMAQLTMVFFGVFPFFYPSHELGLYGLTIIMDLR
ncbi:hypothetical protein BDD12DRAFT_821448 [Trichophaea hybrida]|nr:hypothetical protein BDD12DRAFT_821448 [Trichophaea hybrida]